MPKQLGRETLDLNLVRNISSFTLTLGATSATDVLDVQPVVERRDRTSSALVETRSGEPGRFGEAEIKEALAAAPELPEYETLRVGLEKLMQALMDTRP
jgi:hypothetical protein